MKDMSNNEVVLRLGAQTNRKRTIIAIASGLIFGTISGFTYHRRHSEFDLAEAIALMSILTIPCIVLFSLIPTRSDIVIRLFKEHLTLQKRYRKPMAVVFSDIAEAQYECSLDGDYPIMRIHFKSSSKPSLYIVLPFRKKQINELLLHFHNSGINVYTHEFAS